MCRSVSRPVNAWASSVRRAPANQLSAGSLRESLCPVRVRSCSTASTFWRCTLRAAVDLIGETLKDIIARLEDADLQRVIDAARLAGLHETIMRLPQAYDTVVTGNGAHLPRGFRQRLGLARAFFGDPDLVVLDEPNSSLDSLGERMLFDAIERMKAADTIVILITHRIGILGATDKLAIMEGGAVSAFGDSREVFERCLARPQVASREHVS
jgi:ABC-type protease/lipase transport system fused ATPase/permease subunit